MAKCWKCGITFRAEPGDEYCPNDACANYELTAEEIEREDDDE
jgi:hypothetical protein